MEDVHPSIVLDEPDSIPIADLRDVPLEDLLRDSDALRLVSKVMEDTEGPARIGVAMFSSSI